ncbi:FAD-binding protein [Streptomyces sp. YC537]|uniref:FAD-binding protein n=2 Tax=Streptomyces boluensis TaxID=1775135 RepID=A0A964UYD9_9ACTN|nr:FAD-binding protein [Streptomyces boluensis]
MLTAGVLADYAGQVTVIDRDALPAGPRPRKSLPQARHAHLLWSGGARSFERLLPGVTEEWLAAGARRIPLPTGMVTMSAQGWLRRWPKEMQFMITCSRDLLDWTVRRRVTARDNVSVLHQHEMRHLTGDARRVTGAVVRGADGTEQTLTADLVVDATGRSSQAPQWLDALGVRGIEEATVDSGLVYATRVYHAPPDASEFPLINVQSVPSARVPGQTATIVPIENDQWLVTLSGTRGGEPTRDPAAFEPFARTVRHPVVADVLAHTTPVTERVTVSRSTVNRRRYFENAHTWPDGFLAVGDSVATYNPLYGHGMSVAAQGVEALSDALDSRNPHTPGFTRDVQGAIGRTTNLPWTLATSQDILYPEAVGHRPPKGTALINSYADRLVRTAIGRAQVMEAFLAVITLSEKPAARWLHPDTAIGVLRGPGLPPLDGPPLTEQEIKTATGGSPDLTATPKATGRE